jgi:DNA-binding GntR family transcriptional regulator
LRGRRTGEFERSELLPTKLAGYLRAEIVSGRLKPGERLIEQAIAEDCGVSRVPLREALRILATEGLIVISPHRGASVNTLSETELVELFGARAAIEGFAAMNAAIKQPKFALVSMRKILERMRAAVKLDDRVTYYSLAAEFHTELVQAGGNAVIVRMYEQIRHQLSRYQAAMSAMPDLPSRSNVEHARILKAIESGDEQAARAAAEGHITALVEQFQQAKGDVGARAPGNVKSR